MTDEARKAKEYLQGIERARRRAHSQESMMAVMDEAVSRFKWMASQTTPGSDVCRDCLEDIQRAEGYKAEYERERQQWLVQADAIKSEIEAVKDETQRAILYRRYVDCLTVEQTAEALGYSARQTARLQDKALDCFWYNHSRRKGEGD